MNDEPTPIRPDMAALAEAVRSGLAMQRQASFENAELSANEESLFFATQNAFAALLGSPTFAAMTTAIGLEDAISAMVDVASRAASLLIAKRAESTAIFIPSGDPMLKVLSSITQIQRAVGDPSNPAVAEGELTSTATGMLQGFDSDWALAGIGLGNTPYEVVAPDGTVGTHLFAAALLIVEAGRQTYLERSAASDRPN